jgi:hypothetical protein
MGMGIRRTERREVMTKDKFWYRWPENYFDDKYYIPWFVITRRLIFWPLLLLGMSLTFVAITLAFNLKEAKRFWRNV